MQSRQSACTRLHIEAKSGHKQHAAQITRGHVVVLTLPGSCATHDEKMSSLGYKLQFQATHQYLSIIQKLHMNPIGHPSNIHPATSLLPQNRTGEVTSAKEAGAAISLPDHIKLLSDLIEKSSPTGDQLKPLEPQIKLIRRNLNTDIVTEQAVLDLVACAKNPRINDPKAQAEVIATCDLALKKLLSREFQPIHSHIVNPQIQRPPDFEKIRADIKSIELAPGKPHEEHSGSLTSMMRAITGKVSEKRAWDKSTQTINKANRRVVNRIQMDLEKRLEQYRQPPA
jgi:hypothetical protein